MWTRLEIREIDVSPRRSAAMYWYRATSKQELATSASTNQSRQNEVLMRKTIQGLSQTHFQTTIHLLHIRPLHKHSKKQVKQSLIDSRTRWMNWITTGKSCSQDTAWCGYFEEVLIFTLKGGYFKYFQWERSAKHNANNGPWQHWTKYVIRETFNFTSFHKFDQKGIRHTGWSRLQGGVVPP